MCKVTVRVVQKDGYSPCPFARVDVFRIYRFLWWEFPWYVTGKTADFYGYCSFILVKNAKYRFRITWVGADRRRRRWREPLRTQICPWLMTARAPW